MSADTEDTSELGKIADALNAIARALERLGLADAATPMGAIELLAEEIHNGFAALTGTMTTLKDEEP